MVSIWVAHGEYCLRPLIDFRRPRFYFVRVRVCSAPSLSVRSKVMFIQKILRLEKLRWRQDIREKHGRLKLSWIYMCWFENIILGAAWKRPGRRLFLERIIFVYIFKFRRVSGISRFWKEDESSAYQVSHDEHFKNAARNPLKKKKKKSILVYTYIFVKKSGVVEYCSGRPKGTFVARTCIRSPYEHLAFEI